MPDWTKKNFDDLRDVSPEGVQIQWRFARFETGPEGPRPDLRRCQKARRR